MCSILLIPPVTTRSQHSIYTLFRGHKGGMITMEYQDVMVEIGAPGRQGKKKGDYGLQGPTGPQCMHDFDLPS